MKLTTDIYRRIAAAKVFIDEHYHQPIDLDQIARQACLSRFHFHRLFSRIYKKTPHQYLTCIRLNTAKELLAQENISIADVCSSIGFESATSFSMLFSRQNGCTPQYFRHAIRQKQELAKHQPRRFVPHCFIDRYKIGHAQQAT
ncbi:MAG TPA: AraC family transcriptional regulator [Chitinophagaceae bacterium]|nr:AraC family transcriptional regulator [Chitinophagaceae bacterium]